MTRELSKWLSLCAVVVFCLLDSAVSRAGTLDPRLTALAAGKMPVTRSVGSHGTSVPLSPFEPRLDSAGRVQVYIYPGVLGGLLPSVSELENLGAVQVRVSVPLRVVQAWVPIRALKALAALPDVGRVTVPTYTVTPHPPIQVARPPLPEGQGVVRRPLTRGVPTGLSIDTEAVQAMQANQLQSVNAQGAGIKVGVISDDNSGLAASQAAGYLPSSIFSDPTYPGTTPAPGDPAEGTAMLEEVHAMAPGASLGFCGPSTSVDFLTCYTDLVNWGANVIVDDLGFQLNDMFTTGATADGSFASAITQITQTNSKVAFLSDAGNDAQDYFEAAYVAGPACTINGTAYSSCMDFGKALGQPSANEIAVTIDSTSTPFISILEWNDPLGSTADQLVLYLVNGSGTMLATGVAGPTSDGRPGEGLSYTAATAGEIDYIEIACTTCSDPITIKIMGNGDGAVQFTTPTTGSIDAGQKVAAGVLATVAAGVVSQSPLAVNMENFSAIGPYFYGAYTGTTTLAKPDLTGIDGVTVSGAGGFGISQPNGSALFCGTSATSPNVGSLIAGLMSADPGQPATFYYSALENSASQTAIGTSPFTGCSTPPTTTGYTPAGAGAGLAQGFAALKSFFTFPSTSITAPIAVANGASGTITEPTNLAVHFTATVQAGTNTAAAANCQWNAGGVLQTGASVAYTFPSVGTYTIVANCPDSRGILSPTAPTLTVNAQNIPAPTVTISNTTQTNINLTLTGAQPLTVSATSSNNAVLPDTGITFSSGCGTTTLSCAVSLSPTAQANGSATVTITDTDQYGQKGSGNTQVSYTYTPPPPSSGGGGGGMNIFVLMALIGLIASKRGRTIITT